MFRSRWAAVGAAVAVTLGAGGVSLTQAAISTCEKPVYVALDAPCRVVDTRPGDSNIGPKATPIGAGDTAAYTIQITGANGDCTGGLAIPADAVAVATNVTVIQPNGAPSGRSFFTVYPADADRPTTSNLNFLNGDPPTPNKVDVGLSADGKITIYNNEGTAHAAVDVFGYYVDHTHDDRYYTEAEVDAALSGKSNSADVYTKAQVDTALIGSKSFVVAAAGNQQLSVPMPSTPFGGSSSIRSVTVDVPANGTLVVQASASIRGTDTVTTQASCGITTGNALDNAATLHADVTDNQDVPISAVRSFDVTPGSVTVQFRCVTNLIGGVVIRATTMDVYDSSIVATFVPD